MKAFASPAMSNRPVNPAILAGSTPMRESCGDVETSKRYQEHRHMLLMLSASPACSTTTQAGKAQTLSVLLTDNPCPCLWPARECNASCAFHIKPLRGKISHRTCIETPVQKQQQQTAAATRSACTVKIVTLKHGEDNSG